MLVTTSMSRACIPTTIALIVAIGCDEGRSGHDAGFFRTTPTDGSTLTDTGTVERADSGEVADVGHVALVLVSRVIDGDTVVLSADAQSMSPDARPLNGVTIRMLGVDAPEIAHPPDPTPADCWGPESQAAARNLMQGLQVTLEFDSTLRDPFDRLLAYIILPDGREANAVMIRSGDARSFRRYRHRRRDEYDRLEAEAERDGIRLWTCP